MIKSLTVFSETLQLALHLSYLQIKFDDEIKGNYFDFQA